MRASIRLSSAALALTIVAGTVAALLAQTTEQKPAPAPRLADGRPDLNGVWSFATLTPLERPASMSDKTTLSDEEAAAIEKGTLEVQDRDRRDGEGPGGRGSDGRTDLDRAYNQFWWDYGTKVVNTRRTSLVVDPPDGRIPHLLPEAARRVAARTAIESRPPNGPEDRPLRERCLNILTAGPPMLPGPYNNNVQLFQTPGLIAIHAEMIHDTRLVPIGGSPHLTPAIRQWLGDSRATWEGDTLVVDTTNFTGKTAFRGSSESLHLIERFTRVSADTLLYEFTVSDPTAWARRWSVAVPMTRSADKIYEYACHEGNLGLAGILAGARADERASRGSSAAR